MFKPSTIFLAAATAIASPAIAHEKAVPTPTQDEMTFLRDHFRVNYCIDGWYTLRAQELDANNRALFNEQIDTIKEFCYDHESVDRDRYGDNMDAFIKKYGPKTAREIADAEYAKPQYDIYVPPEEYPQFDKE